MSQVDLVHCKEQGTGINTEKKKGGTIDSGRWINKKEDEEGKKRKQKKKKKKKRV